MLENFLAIILNLKTTSFFLIRSKLKVHVENFLRGDYIASFQINKQYWSQRALSKQRISQSKCLEQLRNYSEESN